MCIRKTRRYVSGSLVSGHGRPGSQYPGKISLRQVLGASQADRDSAGTYRRRLSPLAPPVIPAKGTRRRCSHPVVRTESER